MVILYPTNNGDSTMIDFLTNHANDSIQSIDKDRNNSLILPTMLIYVDLVWFMPSYPHIHAHFIVGASVEVFYISVVVDALYNMIYRYKNNMFIPNKS